MSERCFSCEIIIKKQQEKGREVSTVLELGSLSRLGNKGVATSSSRLTIVEKARR